MNNDASKLRTQPATDDKPLASISFDIDNLWSYMKIHGDAGWDTFPSYLEIFIPRIIDLLDRLNLKITFFIVGLDVASEKNRDVFKLLTENGHEVGNHSFSHEPWLHRYPKDHMRKEIMETHEHIYRNTGENPTGFRGPGFSWSLNLLEILAENSYVYDASSFPTYIGPLARAYYFWTSNLSEEEKTRRNGLYGHIRDGMRPIKPFFVKLVSGAKMLEIPVTTIPIIKIPFHLSYLLYLYRLSPYLMFIYLRFALTMCQLTGTEPSFLLHPLDVLGGDQVPELGFFPGMNFEGSKKIEILRQVLAKLANYFNLVTMSSHAQSLINNKKIRTISYRQLRISK